MARTGTVLRNTKETQIEVVVNLDDGDVNVKTGIGFFDHMLTAFGFYAKIGLTVQATGDLYVDGHHTVEDVGICLGLALKPALGDRAGIPRYDSCLTVEFMRALAMNAGITLHQKCFYGANAHHITEGLFKSLGMAVRDAVKVEGSGVVSTKGVL